MFPISHLKPELLLECVMLVFCLISWVVHSYGDAYWDKVYMVLKYMLSALLLLCNIFDCKLVIMWRPACCTDHKRLCLDVTTELWLIQSNMIHRWSWHCGTQQGRKTNDRLRPLSYPDTDVILMCFSIDSPDSLGNDISRKPEILFISFILAYPYLGQGLSYWKQLFTESSLYAGSSCVLSKSRGASW